MVQVVERALKRLPRWQTFLSRMTWLGQGRSKGRILPLDLFPNFEETVL